MPQASEAVTVKVRVTTQPLVASLWETLTVGVPQLSVAETRALTLASVGRLAGLQPRFEPVGTLVNVGAVVSVTVMVCVHGLEFPLWSVAVQVREMNCGQVPETVSL